VKTPEEVAAIAQDEQIDAAARARVIAAYIRERDAEHAEALATLDRHWYCQLDARIEELTDCSARIRLGEEVD
jgi:hypothetical protein